MSPPPCIRSFLAGWLSLSNHRYGGFVRAEHTWARCAPSPTNTCTGGSSGALLTPQDSLSAAAWHRHEAFPFGFSTLAPHTHPHTLTPLIPTRLFLFVVWNIKVNFWPPPTYVSLPLSQLLSQAVKICRHVEPYIAQATRDYVFVPLCTEILLLY